MKKIYTNVATSRNKILLRYYDTDKLKSVKQKIDFTPVLYVPTDDLDVTDEYATIHGCKLRKINFSDLLEYRDFRKHYNEMNQPLYGDINPKIQYISDFHDNHQLTNLNHIRIFNLDIEVDHGDKFPNPMRADMPINAMCIYDNIENTQHIFALEHSGKTWSQNVRWKDSKYQFEYNGFQNEIELLEAFLEFWTKDYPDIITGWYTDGFDIPYLINRIENVLGEKQKYKLSPWGLINEKTNKMKKIVYTLVGISNLDYHALYLKYAYSPQESYKLDNIAYVELNDRKISYSEFSSLPELYRKNFQKFIDYNIKDVDIVQRLDDKKGFLALVISMAYYAKINFDDVASPIRIWDSLIYNYLKPQGIQIDPESHAHKFEKYTGAYVKEPQIGRHDWIVSMDIKSEYPSLMRSINISPDTLENIPAVYLPMDELLQKTKYDVFTLKLQGDNLSMAANGTLYSRDKPGFLNVLLTRLFDERKVNKKKMLEAQASAERSTGEEKKSWLKKAGLFYVQQYAQKVLLNACYGNLGNEFSRWYDIRLAEAITTSGQLAIRWAENAVNVYLNKVLITENVDYVIYIDTDSIIVNCGSIVEHFMKNEKDKSKIVDKLDVFFKTKISKVIEDAYNDLARRMNHREQLMFMNREAIADRAIFCSKKHYFMRVWDSEGIRYAEPKIKIVGMGFIKSDTPEFCRKHCKEKMVIEALDGTNESFVNAINDFETEFYARPVEDIAKTTGVSVIKRYMDGTGSYVLGTPIGSKSAIIYNRLRKQHKLGTEYPEIQEGDKIKYLYLVSANPIGENTVGFLSFLPEKFKLNNFVDRKTMFNKAFIGPISEILEAMKWQKEIVASLF